MIDIERYRDHLAPLGGRRAAMTDKVVTWSSVNSGSGNAAGLTRMATLVRESFAPLGAEVEEVALPPGESIDASGEVRRREFLPALRIAKRPGAPRRVLLTGHIDTVFAADHPFQTSRHIDDNTLNGPGVADMKGGLIVMREALAALEASPFAAGLGWEVLISPDEEIGSPGSASLLAARAPHADFGMTCEPALADGTLAGARKGSGNFTAVLRGRAAHAGRDFAAGCNAVVALADYVAGLDALNGQRAGVTVNPAVISGGTANNIVPDLAILRFNVRVGEADDTSWVADRLAVLGARVGARDGIALDLHGGFNRPPKPMTAEQERLFSALRACGEGLGLDIAWQATGGCCEGNNLAAAGLPNIDTLGVRGGKIHSADEFVLLDSLVERARLSACLLMAFADGRLEHLRREPGS